MEKSEHIAAIAAALLNFKEKKLCEQEKGRLISMKCHYCGSPMEKKATFCNICGRRPQDVSLNDDELSRVEKGYCKIEDVLQSWQESIKGIEAERNKLFIVNAGRMNHGKSSLFNALLGREEFAVKDIRCTKENKEVLWEDNLFLIDTPGLDATDEDDTVAFDAYRKSACIIFVHKTSIGELHKSELDTVKQLMELFPSREKFLAGFCLVLTCKEEYEDEERDKIVDKIRQEMENHCAVKLSEEQIFTVSNTTYFEAIQEADVENRRILMEYSGIPDLKQYILDKVKVWKTAKGDNLAYKIAEVNKSYVKMLENEKESLAVKRTQHEQQREIAVDKAKVIEAFIEEIRNQKAAIADGKDKKRNLEKSIAELEEKHRREVY